MTKGSPSKASDREIIEAYQRLGHTTKVAQLLGMGNRRVMKVIRAAGIAKSHADVAKAGWSEAKKSKMRDARKAAYAADPTKHINHRCAKNHRSSFLERRVRFVLSEYGIVTETGRRIGRRWPDMVIESAKLIIEVDGKQWHTDPVKEAARDAELSSMGYSVIHLTEADWDSDAAACVGRVKSALQASSSSPPSN